MQLNDDLLRQWDLNSLLPELPDGVSVSDRLLDPIILIDKVSDRLVAKLCAVKKTRGKRSLLQTPTNRHNWVLDDEVLRPLPADAPELFLSVISSRDPNALKYSDAIGLLRARDLPLEVEATEAFLEVGRVGCTHFSAKLSVAGLSADLFPYQARGVRWMADTIRATGGLILADEMGLGKTIQIIALLLLYRELTHGPALVLCPTSLIANWQREIVRFAPSLELTIHRGAERTGIYRELQGPRVVICTYDTAVNDAALLSSIEWDWVICDEAQALKNPDSIRRKTLAQFDRLRTICVTGTPVENSLLDLWSLVDFCVPKVLGSRADFELEFPDSEESAKSLGRFTDPLILRRRVEDVAGDLPSRTEIDIPLELGNKLADHYRRVRASTLQQYGKAGALVATLELQLFCAHPWLRLQPGDTAGHDAELGAVQALPLFTPKVEHAISLIEEAFSNRRKVLVFCIFNRVADLLWQALGNKRAIFWATINGSTPQADRQEIIDSFSSHDGASCLVLNPKAAGAGLNITAATVVVHFSPVWNPAVEAQASARAHRRGQSKPVTIYRLFYKDTVEEVMIDRSSWKQQLANESVPISSRDSSDLQRALQIEPPSR